VSRLSTLLKVIGTDMDRSAIPVNVP